MDNEDKPIEVVGYGKPPKRTRFKPGHSGNPKGRPRKNKTLPDYVEEELRSMVTLTEEGKTRKIPKALALVKIHVRKALTEEDLKSAEFLIKNGLQAGPDKHDNVTALLEEFRERNRCLSVNETSKQESKGGTSILTQVRRRDP